jgi:anthranilate/para-aminobenzoate synthase component I
VELAVTIRTLELGPDGDAWLGCGGGITAGSDPAAEWREIVLKARPLLAACGAELP